MFPLERAKSQSAWTRKTPSTKVAVSDTVAFEFGARPDQFKEHLNVLTYLQALERALNGYAFVGCTDVGVGEKTRKFAPWDTLSYYQDHCCSKSLCNGMPVVSLQTLRAADESTREMWTELMKNDGLTMGEAVVKSRVDAAPFWLWKVDTSLSVEAAMHEEAATTPTKRSSGTLAIEDDHSAKKQRHDDNFAKTSAKGKQLCSAWNSHQNGCAPKCKHGHLHCCNHVLSNGKACMSTGHKRCTGH